MHKAIGLCFFFLFVFVGVVWALYALFNPAEAAQSTPWPGFILALSGACAVLVWLALYFERK